MLHDLQMDGPGFRLRPISNDDAGFVVGLRSNPDLNKFLHVSSGQVEDQLNWLASYFKRKGDFYFIIERRGSRTPEGTISLYDIDETHRTGEWGRWILKPGSLAAIESAYLIYSVAFELLGLDHVYCRTVADNRKVVSFHDSCGIRSRHLLPQHFEIDGKKLDAVEHTLNSADWPAVRQSLHKLSERTARRVRHG